MKIIAISTRGVEPVAATKISAKNGAEYYALTHGEEGRGRWQIRIPLAAREFPVPSPRPIGRMKGTGKVTLPPTIAGAECIGAYEVRCTECGAVGASSLRLPVIPEGGDKSSYPQWYEKDEAMQRMAVLLDQEGRDAGPCFACERDHARKNSLPLNGDYKLVCLYKQDPRGNPLYLLAIGRDDGQHLVLWSLSPGYRGGASFGISGKATVLAQGEEAQGDAGRMGGAACPVVLVTGPCRLTWRRSGRLYGSDADWTADFDGHTWTVAPAHVCADEDAALNY